MVSISGLNRSEIMSRIRGKDTSPEIRVRKLLHKLGYRFRLHKKNMPGSPDIVLPKYRTVFFVNGCFWHGHSCKKGQFHPKTNVEFWSKKIQSNRARDKKVIGELTKIGWNVGVLWECKMNNEAKLLESILKCLGKNGNTHA